MITKQTLTDIIERLQLLNKALAENTKVRKEIIKETDYIIYDMYSDMDKDRFSFDYKTEEQKQLESDLEDTERERDDLELANDDLEEENESLKSEVEELKSKIEELESRIRELEIDKSN